MLSMLYMNDACILFTITFDNYHPTLNTNSAMTYSF